MTEAQIKHMVDRFLQWKLPATFNPDNGISFDPIMNKGHSFESRREPVGTNLLCATEAEAMVRFMVEGLPDGKAPNGTAWRDMPLTAGFLADVFDSYCGAEGHNLVAMVALNALKQKS